MFGSYKLNICIRYHNYGVTMIPIYIYRADIKSTANSFLQITFVSTDIQSLYD